MRLRFLAGASSKEVSLTSRDFGVFAGPPLFMPGGSDLIRALGVFEDFSVDLGRPRKPEVVRERDSLSHLLLTVVGELQQNADLLSFDYTYSFSGAPSRGAGATSGFRAGALGGCVNTRPKGFCTVELWGVSPGGTGRLAQLIDLRQIGSLATDDWGTLRCHRRAATFELHDTLDDLHDFLSTASSSEIRVANRW
jgi:hypothetical protein